MVSEFDLERYVAASTTKSGVPLKVSDRSALIDAANQINKKVAAGGNPAATRDTSSGEAQNVQPEVYTRPAAS
jgi:hypothetical protein